MKTWPLMSALVLALLAAGYLLFRFGPERPNAKDPGNQPVGQQPTAVDNPAKPRNSTDTDNPATDSKPAEQRPANAAQDAESLLTYPRDKDRVVATVNGRNITLQEVVSHIDDRHFKGFADYVSTRVGQFEVRSPLMAGWIRQFADTVALRTEARQRDVSEIVIRREMGAALEQAVAAFKKDYEERMHRAFPTDENSVRDLTRDFLKKRGIGLEVEGLLNAMIPDVLDQNEADQFLKLNQEPINGVLTISHIFVRNRSPKTGALLGEGEMKKARTKIREIERRLAAGEEFESVAIDMSEDRATAAKGGLLHNLLRLDDRLPAAFCRAAWSLRNGEYRGPIETPFGLHFVKRAKWTSMYTILRLDPNNTEVREMVRTRRKEDLLFEVRKEHRLELLY